MTGIVGEALLPLSFLATWFASAWALGRFVTRPLWSLLGPAGRFYLVAGWSLVLVGGLQVAISPFKFRPFTEEALWFVSAGLAVTLTGALNLLNLARRIEDAWLRRTCFAANVALTLVFVAIATHRGAEPPHDPVSVCLIAVALFASVVSGGFHLPLSGRLSQK